MEVQQDFRDLLELLNKHKVDYVIVGGYALGFHGAPRYTGDLDIFVRPDPVNARRIIETLHAFGFGSVGLSAADFEKEGKVVQLGFPPVRVDIVTSITGVSWEQARSNRARGPFGDLTVYYLGYDEFVTNKRALGRKKDIADSSSIRVTYSSVKDSVRAAYPSSVPLLCIKRLSQSFLMNWRSIIDNQVLSHSSGTISVHNKRLAGSENLFAKASSLQLYGRSPRPSVVRRDCPQQVYMSKPSERN